MKAVPAIVTVSTLIFLLGAAPALALNPSLDISHYGHTSWTARDGFSVGAIFAMTQTPDGYMWLGSEFGLFRFDGVHAVPWQPPAGQQLPQKPYALLVTRDGTLWIGTFAGLVSWNGRELTRYPEVGEHFVTSLLEDRDGTVWASVMGSTADPPTGQLCAIRSGHAQCYSQGGAFGAFVWSLFEDSSGTLWAGAESGIWRWKAGPPRQYAMAGGHVGDLTNAEDGSLLVGTTAGLKRLVRDKLEPYPIYRPADRNALLPGREIDSNKLLRDRDGGLWIGTHQRGLIHIHNGRTDVFTTSDGLSGDLSCSLFEDREGNIWFGSSRGLDRFRDLPVTSITTKQGLSSDAASSLVAGTDGSVWVATRDGLTRWKNGQATIFRKETGLPADFVQSLFEDERGRVWASFPAHGLSYFEDGKFVGVRGLPSEEVYFIAGDNSANLWLSGNKGLSHMRDGRLVENFPWSVMGRRQQAKVVVPNQGGVWLAFWIGGGVLYFKDGQVRASYTVADGLGKGPVAGLRLDRDGALWAATQEGGLSRIKDGHVATVTTKNGLPCDTIHWSIEDDERSLWLYTSCGLVRIVRSELDAWIADRNRRLQPTVWDTADGVVLREASPAYYNPPVAKSADGKLWFITGEGIQVADPRHLDLNKVPPPVHIEQISADGKSYWQNLPGTGIAKLRLPSRIRNLTINYTALSLSAPEKIHFKYKLEGQDSDWREVVNDREVQYSNLRPLSYRFRVIASNNSGIWNEQGDTLDFTIAPAYYQTNWFRVLCAAIILTIAWAAYHLRLRQLHHQFEMTLEARVGERARIARDLHDTLLQSFHGLLFRFQAARNLLPNHAEQATDALDAALIRAEQALDEGRRSIQELRPGAAANEAPDQILVATCQDLASSQHSGDTPPRFEVIVEGERRHLAPMVQEEMIRIARELLRNAFQHAHARQIEAEIRYDNDAFRLVIRDDGKGIDPKILKDGGRAGHWGLPGIHERARGMGSQLEFWSQGEAGTEVRLTLPAAIAYEGLRSGSRFKPFRKERTHEHQS
jgi:signal transduction histidine kinase/ligand-binding sensor domain-containing protein